MSNSHDERIEYYRRLIAQFVAGELSADQFEGSFLQEFKAEATTLPEKEFSILNELFLDVDAYCGDSELRTKSNLDAFQLQERAIAALKQLNIE